MLNIIKHMKSSPNSLVKNVVLTPNEYFITAFDELQIKDLNRFCSTKTTPLVMDTTFEVCNLWLTDTAYQNLRLKNNKNEHPWFYGPCLFHMKKTSETFARFALDMVVADPGLNAPSFLGTDMEKAMFAGFKKVFPGLRSLLCVKHLYDRDQRKLSKMGARGQKKILADIYGTNDGITRELGLTTAEDADDFKVKLASLKETWESLAPGFHDWFSRTRAHQFIESVIETAREGSGINGLFYNNAIESLHSKLKATVNGKQNLIDLVDLIQGFLGKQRTEEVRAICKTGEYRLSEEYQCFEVCYYSYFTFNKIFFFFELKKNLLIQSKKIS